MAGYFDVVYGLLFLVPGYLAYKAVVIQRNHPRAHDLTEKTAWSLLASGVSLSIVGLIINVPLTEREVAWQTLARAFLSTSVVAVLLGGAVGLLLKRYDFSKHRLRHNAWEHIDVWGVLNNETKGITVAVVLSEGEEFVGNTEYMGTVSDNDLLITGPEKIHRDEGGTVVERTPTNARHLYVPEDEIQYMLIMDDLT